ncbi:cupin domain protein [Ilyonectria destructans]|nr:cupin domain protein [Ilyonectria destructans]
MDNTAAKSKSPLPSTRRLITTHDEFGKATLHTADDGTWKSLRHGAVSMNLIYTTSQFPVQLNGEADIKAHNEKSNSVGLVSGGGSVCRIVDIAPLNEPMMHRTKSLDYGVVLEGQMEMVLDSGETHLVQRGDVVVQRGTMHAWRNPSRNNWARMMFVLLDSEHVEVAGERLKESLAPGQHETPTSGNDN